MLKRKNIYIKKYIKVVFLSVEEPGIVILSYLLYIKNRKINFKVNSNEDIHIQKLIIQLVSQYYFIIYY